MIRTARPFDAADIEARKQGKRPAVITRYEMAALLLRPEVRKRSVYLHL